MMDVEIEDCDPLESVPGLGVARADGDVVEQAEAAGNVRRRVMARWPDRGEGCIGAAAQHGVAGGDRGAGGAQGGVDAAAAHDRVAVDHGVFAGLRRGADHCHARLREKR